MVPASFRYAFVGVQAEPDALVITPNLPSALTSAGVRNLYWRGRRVQVLVTRDTVTVQGSGLSIHRHYRTGESVRVPAAVAR
jgi:trehalose/maltose hydrolase-like predicted phosphorylase